MSETKSISDTPLLTDQQVVFARTAVRRMDDEDLPVRIGVVTTWHIARSLNWRHDNLMRAGKRYLALHQNHKSGLPSANDVFSVHRTAQQAGVAFTVRGLCGFASWLVYSALKGHPTTQERRRRGFIVAMAKWFPSVDFDSVLTEIATNTLTDSASWFQDRVKVADLARATQYTEAHVRRSLRSARMEEDDSMFDVSFDGTVPGKTALWFVLCSSRPAKMRLRLFNSMMRKLERPATLPEDRLNKLPLEVRHFDINIPEEAEQAVSLLYDKLKGKDEQQAQLLTQWLSDEQNLHAELAALRARAEASEKSTIALEVRARTAEEAVRNMQVSLAASQDQGVTVAMPGAIPELSGIHHSADLRALGWVGILDISGVVLSRIGERDVLDWQADMQLKDTFPAADAIRKVIRFSVGYKWLQSDGMPVVRAAWAQHVFARRVYVSEASSIGNKVKHGEFRNWRWQLWYDAMAAENLVASFKDYMQAWADAGCPDHLVDRDPTLVTGSA